MTAPAPARKVIHPSPAPIAAGPHRAVITQEAPTPITISVSATDTLSHAAHSVATSASPIQRAPSSHT